REAANRMKCSSNMRQLGLACHAYHDVYGLFPPGGKVQPDWNWCGDKGSWIVWTLPFMEQDSIFSRMPNPDTNPPVQYADTGAGCQPNPQGGFDSIGVQTYDWTNNKPRSGMWLVFNQQGLTFPPKLPYSRCPSDAYDLAGSYSNYVGSLGPQCAIGP